MKFTNQEISTFEILSKLMRQANVPPASGIKALLMTAASVSYAPGGNERERRLLNAEELTELITEIVEERDRIGGFTLRPVGTT